MSAVQECDVVLLNPPFFKACNSHNDRMPLSLCYLSAILDGNSVSNVVYNADYSGSDTYWSMKRLFDNFDAFIEAVDDEGALYEEVVQTVLSFRPSVVVIMGADPLVPTKDLGSPFIAANFSRRFRKLGMYTVGIGPYFTLDSSRFSADFDSILSGEPSEAIVEIVRKRPKGVIKGLPIPTNISPSLSHLYPGNQKTDAVMTGFGCVQPCGFCIAGKLYRDLKRRVRTVEPETVVMDILQRPEKRLYLNDLNFSGYSIERLTILAACFQEHGIQKEFVIESSVQDITEERLRIFKSMGITTIKLGIEGLTNKLLDGFQKRQTIAQIEHAVELINKSELKFIAYLLIGGVKEDVEYRKTLQYLEGLHPENVVASIWAYDIRGDYRYDTQFSPVTLEKWGIKKEVFYDLLGAQNSFNQTVGKIIP